ncbi:hypothetical protein OE88DRAFT_1723945 [Heliocybe sulcata]|uniref:Uncharacterized protein n=1 Tax=Heliocybe sulcata TaxID=5364 RepID=A0A5C3NA42_9AGAM|nr:hypothetical protein OE88DRAFT_1723945 [Heliocybe sulcata]
MTIQGVFTVMRRAYGAGTPKTPPPTHPIHLVNNGPEPACAVDPILLHNFLAETHQVEGCACDTCAVRDEQARILSDTAEYTSDSDTADTHFNDDTRPRYTRPGLDGGPNHDTQPRTVTSPVETAQLPVGHHTGANRNSPTHATSPEPESSLREESSGVLPAADLPLAENVSDPLSPSDTEVPAHSRSQTGADSNTARIPRVGLGFLLPGRRPGDCPAIFAALDDLPGASLAQPTYEADLVPTPLPLPSSEPYVISFDSPSGSPHIHSPDPQAYPHHGRRHPNFDDYTPLAPPGLPLPSPHRRRRAPILLLDEDDLPLAPPPRYSHRDRRRAPLYLRRDMDAYLSADPAAIDEDLPMYSTYDPLLVRALRSRRQRPHIEGFQETEQARTHHTVRPPSSANENEHEESESPEGGHHGFVRFMGRLCRSTARLCTFADQSRDGVESGYGMQDSDRVPMDVIRRELVRQEDDRYHDRY